jgi:hypothetical protein
MNTNMSKDKEIQEGTICFVKWRYKGKEFEDTMSFRNFEYGKYYFESDDGDWLVASPSQIISIKQLNQ